MSDNEFENEDISDFEDEIIEDNDNDDDNDEEIDFLSKNSNSNDIILENIDINKYQSKVKQPISYNKLTKYERANIIGIRSQQLTCGAKPLIKNIKGITDVKIIAKMELEQKKLPLIIGRPFPDGTTEYWKIEDLSQ